jgi:hypothetical protein
MTNKDFNISGARFGTVQSKSKKKAEETGKKRIRQRTTMCYDLTEKYVYRRAYGETKLLDALQTEGFHYEQGHAYHFFTGGDIDSLTFFKSIMRQQHIDYFLFSTWCMAAEDIKQLEIWIKEGRIGKMDAFVGEIFPSSYTIENRMLHDMVEETGCGRVAVFRNHSKIYAGYGPKFHFVIESSANINTNPRCENTVITIDEGLFNFYKNIFDGIVSFTKSDRDKEAKKQEENENE